MRHIQRWVGVAVLAMLAGGLVLASHPGGSHLVEVGPVHPAHGFPIWYKDANGLSAELCLEAGRPRALPWCSRGPRRPRPPSPRRARPER